MPLKEKKVAVLSKISEDHSSSSYVPLEYQSALVLQPEMLLDTALLQWVERNFLTKTRRGTEDLLLKRYEGSSSPNDMYVVEHKVSI